MDSLELDYGCGACDFTSKVKDLVDSHIARKHGSEPVAVVPRKASHDPVNHPKHYTNHPSGVECITITRHMSFNLGNAMKYLWRADEKNAPLEDLKKAIWYIKDEIAKRGGDPNS